MNDFELTVPNLYEFGHKEDLPGQLIYHQQRYKYVDPQESPPA